MEKNNKLKILIYSINFSPELTGIGKYNGEMADWLAEKGHDVRVCTAPPYYPEWKIASGYSSRRWLIEVRNAYRVYRAPLWVPRSPSGMKRIIHLLSFALSSSLFNFKFIKWRPDVVWVVEPPLFLSFNALLLAKITGAKSWLHIQDFEVNAAYELGLLKSSISRSLATSIERYLMKKFDVISSISGKMIDLARTKISGSSEIKSFPNWVDLDALTASIDHDYFRDMLSIEREEVVVLYSGNMGNKQGLEFLGAAAEKLSFDKRIKFIFCGDGPGRAVLLSVCEGLSNCKFLELQPTKLLGSLLHMADIHIIPQRSGAADLVMPSKLTGIMASGRPVIVMADAATELQNVVEVKAQCGVVVPPENVDALVSAITMLAGDQVLRQNLGLAGRKFAREHISKDAILSQFEADLLEAVD